MTLGLDHAERGGQRLPRKAGNCCTQHVITPRPFTNHVYKTTKCALLWTKEVHLFEVFLILLFCIATRSP